MVEQRANKSRICSCQMSSRFPKQHSHGSHARQSTLILDQTQSTQRPETPPQTDDQRTQDKPPETKFTKGKWEGAWHSGGAISTELLPKCFGTLFRNVGGGITEPKLFWNYFSNLLFAMVDVPCCPVCSWDGWGLSLGQLRFERYQNICTETTETITASAYILLQFTRDSCNCFYTCSTPSLRELM